MSSQDVKEFECFLWLVCVNCTDIVCPIKIRMPAAMSESTQRRATLTFTDRDERSLRLVQPAELRAKGDGRIWLIGVPQAIRFPAHLTLNYGLLAEYIIP